MLTRVFQVQLDRVAVENALADQPLPINPFEPAASVEPKPDAPVPLIKTARDILESAGVTFPAGASTSFDPFACTLTVTNTQANLDLCEVYFQSVCNLCTHHMSFVLTVIEGPGAIIRQANDTAAAQEDAAKALADLMQHATNPRPKTHTQVKEVQQKALVRVVQEAFVQAFSGTRATTRSVKEHDFPTMSTDEQGHLAVNHEMQSVGMNLELEPVIGSDYKYIDFAYLLDLHPAPPSARQAATSDPATGHTLEVPLTQVPRLHFAASTRMHTGSTRLLGIAKPYDKPVAGAQGTGGAEDVLWAVFITAHIVRTDVLPRARPEVKAALLKVPDGMRKLAFRVPAGLLENARVHPWQTVQQYFDTHGVAPAIGAEAVIEGEVLTVVNTHENIERVVALVDHLTSKLPKTVALTMHTVQGSADYLRSVAAQAAAQQDHGAQWAQVQQALAAGSHDLKSISTSRLETRFDVRVCLESVQEHAYLAAYGRDEKGHVGPHFENRRVGAVLEFEPTISYDGTSDIMLSHEFHPLPAEAGRGVVLEPGARQKHDFPIEHIHAQQTVTRMHVANGGTQMFSLLQPPGGRAGDQLVATFLHCDVVSHCARRKVNGPTLAQRIAGVPKSASQELFTRSFPVSPDFLHGDVNRSSQEGANLAPSRKSARQILEGAGITFPPGTRVQTGGAKSEIMVRNTTENLNKVEQFVKWMEHECRPSVVALTSHVLEAPGPMVRRLLTSMEGRGNHRAELDLLLEEVRQGRAKDLGITRIETKGGEDGKAEQGVQQPFFTGALENDMRLVGFRTEVKVKREGPHAAPGFLISSEFHTAPPLEHREYVIVDEGRRLEFPLTDFHVMKLTSAPLVPDGHARLLAVWKPVGKPEWEKADVLQVYFITCDEVPALE